LQGSLSNEAEIVFVDKSTFKPACDKIFPVMPNADDVKLQLAKRLIWWQSPAEAVKDEPRLLAQVMVLGTWEDVQQARAIWPQSAFRTVLKNPPPGLFDPKSWNYWHLIFHLPVPPLPARNPGFDWRVAQR